MRGDAGCWRCGLEKAAEEVGLPGSSSSSVTSLLLVVTGVRLFFQAQAMEAGSLCLTVAGALGIK